MTQREIDDALDGLFAYDTGCVSSGIHDEVLRERVKKYLNERTVTRFLRTHYYNAPYTVADVVMFLDWLRDKMGFDP